MKTRRRNDPGALVLPFLLGSSKLSMAKCQPKTRGVATSSKPSLSSTALSVGAIQERLFHRLRKLDAEQLQIVEIVVAAIERGAA